MISPALRGITSAWNRWSSACGALRPQPAHVLVGALLAAVLRLLDARHVLDRHAAVGVVDDALHGRAAALERPVLARYRRIAGSGRESLGLGGKPGELGRVLSAIFPLPTIQPGFNYV